MNLPTQFICCKTKDSLVCPLTSWASDTLGSSKTLPCVLLRFFNTSVQSCCCRCCCSLLHRRRNFCWDIIMPSLHFMIKPISHNFSQLQLTYNPSNKKTIGAEPILGKERNACTCCRWRSTPKPEKKLLPHFNKFLWNQPNPLKI